MVPPRSWYIHEGTINEFVGSSACPQQLRPGRRLDCVERPVVAVASHPWLGHSAYDDVVTGHGFEFGRSRYQFALVLRHLLEPHGGNRCR